VGSVLHVVASLACAVAPNIALLDVARAAQGLMRGRPGGRHPPAPPAAAPYRRRDRSGQHATAAASTLTCRSRRSTARDRSEQHVTTVAATVRYCSVPCQEWTARNAPSHALGRGSEAG